MRRTAPSRAFAVLFAILAGSSGAGSAMAHGWAHAEEHHGERARHDEHVDAKEHHARSTWDADALRLTADDNDGDHGHADVVTAVRGRWDVSAAAEVPARIVTVHTKAEQAPLGVPRALRARGDPSGGPPPRLRSPPSA